LAVAQQFARGRRPAASDEANLIRVEDEIRVAVHAVGDAVNELTDAQPDGSPLRL
jgi:hypothetical protein